MAQASLAQFRGSLQVVHIHGDRSEELAFVYWNDNALGSPIELGEDALRIMRRLNGSFYLEIGNMIHEGELSALEEILFEWGRDEGWLEVHKTD